MSAPSLDPDALPQPTLPMVAFPMAASPPVAPSPTPVVPLAVLRPYVPELKAWDWWELMRDAATYPWRRDGWYILIPGAFLGLALIIGSLFGMQLSFASGIFGWGYFTAYYLSVMETTINGQDQPPEWPSISSITEDIVGPAIIVQIALLLSVLPLLLYNAAMGEDTNEWISLLLGLFALIYLPFALLNYALHGGPMALSPHRVLPGIFRSRAGCLALMGFQLGIIPLLAALVVGTLWVPWIGYLLAVLVIFYGLVAHGRLMGLFYRRYQHKLQW